MVCGAKTEKGTCHNKTKEGELCWRHSKTAETKAKVPKAKVPKAKVPKAKVPKAKVPKAKVPKAKVPKASANFKFKLGDYIAAEVKSGGSTYWHFAIVDEYINPKTGSFRYFPIEPEVLDEKTYSDRIETIVGVKKDPQPERSKIGGIMKPPRATPEGKSYGRTYKVVTLNQLRKGFLQKSKI